MLKTMQKHVRYLLKGYIESPFASKKLQEEGRFDLEKLPVGYFKSFGNKNPDKVFYVIWRKDMGSGFFSNFSHILCHLKIADMAGMIPVVDFMNYKTLYNEKHPVNETENAWEYYYKKVSEYSLDEVYQSKNVFFCSGSYPAFMSFSITNIPGLYQDVYRKYVCLNHHIEEVLLDYYKLFSCRVLGVHFRGQEQQLAVGHSFPPTERQMIKYTRDIIEKYDIDKIFVVTEEKSYLDLFISKFGSKVIFTNNFRTYSDNAYNMEPREKHRYLLGLEVLIDAHLLSMCSGILCGDSNVSEFARFANNNKYEFVYKIYNGINSSNWLVARYLYRIKKLLPRDWGGLADEVCIC